VQPAPDDDDDVLFSSAEPGGRSDDRDTDPDGGGGDGRTEQGSEGRPPAPFRRVAQQSDRSGDHGEGPSFADLREIAIDGNGEDLRVTVLVDGPVREKLAEGEVVGLGVDLYQGDDKNESSYQLFADGRSDGWYAFLYAHDRFVAYKGSFGIDGDRFAFIVPVSSVGGFDGGRVSAFFDWSRAKDPRNDFSEDHAPDKGTLRVPIINLP
jgi:hypothetical protein